MSLTNENPSGQPNGIIGCGTEGLGATGDVPSLSDIAPERPSALAVNPMPIPDELRALRQWVVWKYERRRDKWTKVPYQRNSRKAQVTNPGTWCSFDEAMNVVMSGWDGIGFVFRADGPHVGVDLDHCIDEDGTLKPSAVEIVAEFGTYTETTVSGTGLHLLCRGALPVELLRGKGTGRRKIGIEVYRSGRYFTITGHHWRGSSREIADCTPQLAKLLGTITKSAETTPSTNGRHHHNSHRPTDEQIIAKAQGSKNGEKFCRLWSGDISGYESHSDADLALVSIVSFWVGPDEQRIDGLFRQSGLVRDKWTQREDYRSETIRKALEGNREFYQWNGRRGRKLREQSATLNSESRDEIDATKCPIGLQDPDDVGLTKFLADLITEKDRFARDPGGKLYRFQSGVYRAYGERFILAEVKRLANVHKHTARWSPRLGEAVVEYIGVDAPELWERPPMDVVNVRNGLLRFEDRVLLPHAPEHLSAVQLPMRYDPAATCPAIEKFLAETFPIDALDLAWEVPAWLMRPDTSIQKSVLAIGEGANGKSRWIALLIAFLGKINTCGLSLHKLESDRFAAARLIGKLLNACPDLPSEHLSSTSVFKALTGGDVLTAEYKFRDSFDFVPFARLVFSANHPPRSQDDSHGFFRRWLVIPFDRTFSGTAAIPSDELDARLSTPAELSGLLNKALYALPRMIAQRGFSEPGSVQRAGDDFRSTTDPLAVWIDQNVLPNSSAIVGKDQLRSAYNVDASRAGRPVLTKEAFGARLAKIMPNLQDAQRTIGGKPKTWCYVGIGLRIGDFGDPCEERPSLPSRAIPLLVSVPTNRVATSDLEVQESESQEVEQVEEMRVKLVNPVTCEHVWCNELTSDGRVRCMCITCGKFYGYVDDNPAVATLR